MLSLCPERNQLIRPVAPADRAHSGFARIILEVGAATVPSDVRDTWCLVGRLTDPEVYPRPDGTVSSRVACLAL